MVEFVSCIYYVFVYFCMNSFICVFVCVYRALQNSLVYTISVVSVFVSYTYVCYVLVYFVLYVYNCMHKRTIKYLVSCILLTGPHKLEAQPNGSFYTVLVPSFLVR